MNTTDGIEKNQDSSNKKSHSPKRVDKIHLENQKVRSFLLAKIYAPRVARSLMRGCLGELFSQSKSWLALSKQCPSRKKLKHHVVVVFN